MVMGMERVGERIYIWIEMHGTLHFLDSIVTFVWKYLNLTTFRLSIQIRTKTA
jgi:hypothetical protein